MKFGHFDDTKREYVITTPQTPLPWINYLGNEDFFSLISNTCGGYSFYKDAKLPRLTRYRYNNVPADTNGRYYFIHHNGTVWTPGWQPVKPPLDTYECRHGLGYSKFLSSKNGIHAELTAFVPLHETCEADRLILRNDTQENQTLSLTSRKYRKSKGRKGRLLLPIYRQRGRSDRLPPFVCHPRPGTGKKLYLFARLCRKSCG